MKGMSEATVTIHQNQLMHCLRQMTIHNEHFDHRYWSIWDAEDLERIAGMIRDGYVRERRDVRAPGQKEKTRG